MPQEPEHQQQAIVVAAHTDIIASDVYYWRLRGETAVLEQRHVPTLRAGGVTVICDHLGGDTPYAYVPNTNFTTSPLQRALRLFDDAHREAEESPSIVLAQSVGDIRRAQREGKIALVLCLEGGMPLENELAYLRNFHRLGLRCLGLTHNYRNPLADGARERSGGGLTHFGTDVVKECNRLGIIVDVSHLSDRGIDDVLKESSQPIMASHSNARAVREHIRNLTDDHIRAIASGGGVIGIHAMNSLVSASPQPTLDDLLRHVVHIVEVGGIDCVGIGPDLMENWQEDKMRVVSEEAQKFAAVPVTPGDWRYPTGFSSLAHVPNLTNGLKALGFSAEDLVKFLGGNWMRLFAQVWGPAGGS